MMRPTSKIIQKSVLKFATASNVAIRSFSNSYKQNTNNSSNYDYFKSNTNFKYGLLGGLSLAAAGLKATDDGNADDDNTETTENNVDRKLWHGLKLELYMYYGCPFCSRLEAYLKYRQIAYTRIEVNAMTKSEVKVVGKEFGGYKKVPFMVATVEETGERIGLKDSSRIVSAFESFILSKEKSVNRLKFLFDKCYPEIELTHDLVTGEPLKKPVKDYANVRMVMRDQIEIEDLPSNKDLKREQRWRQWVQDKLLHAIAPNLYRNYGESIASTKHYISISPKFGNTWTGTTINYVGGPAMYHIGQIIVRRHKNILTNNDPRIDLYKFCDEWVAGLPNKNGFMSGKDEPNIADLEAFGTLAMLEGTPVFPDMIAHTSIKKWYNKMRKTVGDKQSTNVDEGCFIQADP
jgi:microsomal prostaglandin-E synthase 2